MQEGRSGEGTGAVMSPAWRRVGIGTVLALTTCALALAQVPSAPAKAGSAHASKQGKRTGKPRIAYSSDVNDPNSSPPQVFPLSPGKDFDIYSIDADGSAQQRLTSSIGNDQFVNWSPDGTRIAFESNRDADYDIYVMDADGRNVVQLTNDPAIDSVPAWSADGRQISFTTFRDGDPEIYVMNADGSAPKRITYSPGWDFAFSNWSEDDRIVFNSDRDGSGPPGGPLPLRPFDIYAMDADGSAVQRLTDDPANDSAPMWSPDGSRIAFVSMRDGDAEISVMNADGTAQTRITSNAAVDGNPAWSPDGDRITFDSDRDGDFEIFTMSADGSSVRQLTRNTAYDFGPRFSPITP